MAISSVFNQSVALGQPIPEQITLYPIAYFEIVTPFEVINSALLPHNLHLRKINHHLTKNLYVIDKVREYFVDFLFLYVSAFQLQASDFLIPGFHEPHTLG